MKGRSLKLKEANKSINAVESFCSILWDLEGHHFVTSSSSDSSVSIFDSANLSNPPKILRNHKDGVTALALSPNSTCLASGSIDHSVKLYRFPGGEFQTNITRFTLPIRTLAFNKSGSMLGAAGDDEGIKLINTVDGSIARVLKAHKGSVTSLAFDPNGDYLASVDSSGTVIFWELCTGEVLHTLKGVAPGFASDMSVLCVLSWSPDGNLLAVPGLKGDVMAYDRDTAEKVFSLKGEHEKSVCYVSWSPNGKYMATSGLDRQVLIWDVKKKQDIDRQKFDNRVSCMAWKPNANTLAVIDVMGKYGMWDSPVPSSMKSPIDGAPSLKSKSNGLLFFDDDVDDDQEFGNKGNQSDAEEDSFGESEQVSRKRLRKQSKYDDMLDEDSDDLLELPKVESRKKVSRQNKESSDEANKKLGSVDKPTKPKMQEAFQPGSTPAQPGKRNFLCYNMLGSITTIENDAGNFHIEVDFHDTGRGPRVPSRTDYFGFTMASLNESGSVFANPCKGEKNMSTLMYSPFSSWANNSEWSMRFEVEEVKAVALGAGWIAAATSHNFLRIFTEGGLQKHIISLDGPVVTMAGLKDQLAVVTHASHSLPSNDQMLEFKVFNMSNATLPLAGRLPLTPGSSLSWLGFSDEGHLSSYDSEGTLRVYTDQYNGSWIPLYTTTKEKKSEESYWIVGLNASKLFCIVCKSPETSPQVSPKPILTLLDLSFPLASSDLGAGELENEFLLNNLYLSQARKKIENMISLGLDTSLEEDEVMTLETCLNRCVLRLIDACCKGDKLVRATELVRLLTSDKSVKGAIRLVTALKIPVLAERFNGILEERMVNEANPSVVEVEKRLELPEYKRTEIEVKVEEHQEKVSGVVNSVLKPLKNKESHSNGKEKTTTTQNHRPTNPFAKASITQKSSLFDSLKKS